MLGLSTEFVCNVQKYDGARDAPPPFVLGTQSFRELCEILNIAANLFLDECLFVRLHIRRFH